MATGDVNDIVNRMVAVLPPWFPTPIASSPILQGVLTGIATPLAFAYSAIAYSRLQSRLKTMFGPFLDLATFDYLGPTFARRLGETDMSFQSRLLGLLLCPRNTLSGITQMLTVLTGYAPAILEPGVGGGGWDDTPAFAFDDAGCWSGGTLSITAFRPPGQGIPNVDGFDGGNGGFDVGVIEWSDISQVTGAVTDAEIALRVRQWVAAGVNYTLTISNPVPVIVLIGAGFELIGDGNILTGQR
jgi:hypothetical protein